MTTSFCPTVRHAAACALAILAIAATSSPALASPILTLTPSTTVLNPGDPFAVDVEIQGVTDLFFFDITLTIDDVNTVTFRGTDNDPGDPDDDPTAEGSFLSGGIPGSTFYFDDVVSPAAAHAINAVIGCCGVSGDGLLFTAFFRAGVNPGRAVIGFGDVVLFDSTLDPNGNPGVIVPTAGDLIGTTVEVGPSATPVPEPATFGLVGAGMVAAWRRRRRHK